MLRGKPSAQHDSALFTTGQASFAVRLGRTAKAGKRTAKGLPCVFYRGARQKRTAPFCTAKGLCRAPFLETHGEPLAVR
jgi:hypothetical protein